VTDIGEAASRIKTAWDDAEEKLKRTEWVKGTLTIPAVNELRYAGYHVLEGLASAAREGGGEHFDKAEKHCKRAAYDAVEAEFLFYARQLRQFQEDYRNVPIDIPGTNYLEIKVRANATMDLVRQVRSSKESKESRDKYYERILPHCDQLGKDMRILDAAREELNKKWKLRPQTEEGTRRRWMVTIFATIVGIAFGGFGVKLWLEPASASAERIAPASQAPSEPRQQSQPERPQQDQ
jgi:hypothetical protein